MQAFIVSFVVTTLLSLVAIPYGRRRPAGKPLAWGEAMAASVYAFGVMFLAYGVVPHQWLTWVQNELGWRADKKLYGIGNVFKSKADGGFFPFDINWLQIGDILVTIIYGFYLGLMIYLWSWWQKRGKTAAAPVAATSSYGRPLVRKV